MSMYSYQETLLVQTIDGPNLTASVAQTSIIATESKYTLPQNYLRIGQKLRICSKGRISNIVTTPGTLTLNLKFGSVIIWNSGAIPLNVVAKTNVPWWLELEMVCRSIGGGTSATMLPIGTLQSESIIGSPANSAGGNGSLILPVTNPAVSPGFDSTAAQQIDLLATWSLSNANAIQTVSYTIESLN